MKVYFIHVGNAIERDPSLNNSFYLQRDDFLTGKKRWFLKHDIVNADTQMNSIANSGVEVEHGHFSNRKSLKGIYNAVRTICRLNKRKDIDAIHVLWGSSTGLITTIFSRKPVVVSFCGSDLLGNKTAKGKITFGGKINRIFSICASLFASQNITKSEQMKSVLPKFAQRKTIVIPNGVNLKGFYPMSESEARKQLNWPIEGKRLLFFYTEGQVVKNKELADDVLALVSKERDDVTMVVATKIAHEKLLYYYNACDAMILTSYHEGSNNSLKEANACNLPIVSVNVGDSEERLSSVNNSFVVSSFSAQEIGNHLLTIFENGLRSDGEKDSKNVSLDNVAKRIIDVYKKVI